MKRFLLVAILALLSILSTLFTAFPSKAIVMRHDVKPASYYVAASKYESVIDLSFVTGTLIAPQWILTAAHGVDYMPAKQQVSIKGKQYVVESIIRHPDYNKLNLSHDIALLKLDRPVSDVVSTGIYTSPDEQGQHVWFVGSGRIGNGKQGITGDSNSINHAENVVEQASELWLMFDFDGPKDKALPLEGISGPGDSGGPAFITTSQGLKVAGVSSHQRNNDAGEGLYGVEEYYTRTSAHTQWITEIMAKSNDELASIAVAKPMYVKKAASAAEVNALIGVYELAQQANLIIQQCANGQGLCYQWAGSQSEYPLFKTTGNLWFTPVIDRTFSVVKSAPHSVTRLKVSDFHGTRQFVRSAESELIALKHRVHNRGRALVEHVEPKWPEHALKDKIHGSVILSFSINTNGSVFAIKVVESTPPDIFERAAIDALSQWRYAPVETVIRDVLTQIDFEPEP